MKKIIMIVLSLLSLCLSIFAGGEFPYLEIPFPSNDRIRNLPAVSRNVANTSDLVYFATFGLESASETGIDSLIPCDPSLWELEFALSGPEAATIRESTQRLFTFAGDYFLNGYRGFDDYIEAVTASSACSDIQANARHENAMGFWASPVLLETHEHYTFCGTDPILFLLNKSGVLFAIERNFDETASILFHANLREIENSRSSNANFLEDTALMEYKTTPIIIGNTLYALGLQSMIKFDLTQILEVIQYLKFLNIQI